MDEASAKSKGLSDINYLHRGRSFAEDGVDDVRVMELNMNHVRYGRDRLPREKMTVDCITA